MRNHAAPRVHIRCERWRVQVGSILLPTPGMMRRIRVTVDLGDPTVPITPRRAPPSPPPHSPSPPPLHATVEDLVGNDCLADIASSEAYAQIPTS
jgi:hypothetical protein